MAILSLLVTPGCTNRQEKQDAAVTETPDKKSAKKRGATAADEALAFLLSMTWDEARALTASHLEMPPNLRLAADEIEVLKTSEDGVPRRARARGKVYIELPMEEPARLMAQEAFVSEYEVILRGKPVLQRGGSIVEGVDDTTVFYFLGSRLKVIGRHRVKNETEIIAKAILAGGNPNARNKDGSFADPGPPPPLPVRQGPWAGGPNPLLPPLSPDSIPTGVRQKMIDEAGLIEVAPLQVPLGGDTRQKPAPQEITGPPDPAVDKAP